MAWTLALVFAVFVALNQLSILSALLCWAFATLAMIWPTLVNTRDLVPVDAAEGTRSGGPDVAAGRGNGVSDMAVHAWDELPASTRVGAELTWRGVLDALSDPALIVDGDSFIVHLNPRTLDMFPRARLGQPLTSVMRSPALISAVETEDALLTHRIVQIEDRVPMVRKWSAIITSLEPPDAAMQPAKLIVLRDLTSEQQHAQLRSDFIAHASHELRTPLASMKSMVETLQGRAYHDPVARDRFLAMMQEQAARMARLIDDLLTLSRAESRVHLPPETVVDVADAIDTVVDVLRPMAEASDVRVVVENTATRTMIRGDRDDLMQIFQNLIQNALKYGFDGGVVRIDLKETRSGSSNDTNLVVSVSDEGPGISKEHLSRITERFYRVSVAASRKAGGTGLGLAIV
ncbi:MAG: ATP-binding protein, partial [Pseudomonadota bacterium]